MLTERYVVVANDDGNEFSFTTSLGLQYNVYFLPAKEDYFSEFLEVPENIYLFGFSLLNSQVGQLSFDAKVAKTIAYILFDFFRLKENVIIFICDTADKKERQRSITFNKWFRTFDIDDMYEKIDRILEYDISNRYYLSLIYRKDNPDKKLYLNAFQKMVSGLEK